MSKANPQFTLVLKMKKQFRIAVRDGKGVRLDSKEAAFIMFQIDELSRIQPGNVRNDFLTRIYHEIYLTD